MLHLAYLNQSLKQRGHNFKELLLQDTPAIKDKRRVSKSDDQTEGDRIVLDKTKARDIKPTQNNEVDNYRRDR